MKKITKKEFDEITKKERQGILKDISELGVGDGLIVDRSEWDRKNPFSSHIHSVFLRDNKKFSAKALSDKSGWAVLRIK